jgi:hypothetical protein
MNLNDPWSILGLDPDQSDDAIRARYAELVKAHPPDRDPERFERIRDAYRLCADPEARSRVRLFGPDPLADLDELVRLLRGHRPTPVGADAWLEVVRERRLRRPEHDRG